VICPCVASSDAMRTAGRSYNCVRGSVTNMSPSVLPGPSRQQDQAVITPAGVRPRMAWRAGGSRHRACCSSSRAKASLSVSVRPCFAICSGGQGQPTRPVALLCVRRPPAMRVASAAVHAFNSIQTGEACRISPSGRYGSRSLSLSICSPLRLPPLSPRRRAAPPDPTATPTPASLLEPDNAQPYKPCNSTLTRQCETIPNNLPLTHCEPRFV
jgi:hypothetical protein